MQTEQQNNLEDHFSESPFQNDIKIRFLTEVKKMDQETAAEIVDSEKERSEEEKEEFWIWYNEKYFIPDIDLFDDIENLPSEVREILDQYSEHDFTYETCANLVKELNAVGYTCEYYLDAQPYGLRKL
jgi:uncharacterized protein CbrC (UPF0167 family)